MTGTLLPPQERKQLLSFVVVGGGPTGVEVAAELHDMAVDDLSKIYPDLTHLVRIRVIELQDHVLSTYDREISKYTAKEFGRCCLCVAARVPAHAPVLCQQQLLPACREGIDLVLNSRVASVSKGCVSVVDTKKNKTDEIPFGACVWATGVAMHPLVKHLQVLGGFTMPAASSAPAVQADDVHVHRRSGCQKARRRTSGAS